MERIFENKSRPISEKNINGVQFPSTQTLKPSVSIAILLYK